MKRRVDNSAFTLIELMVVVAIILALLSLLMPSLNKAKAAAQRAVCASNLKQMGLANMSYAAAYKGRNVHERGEVFEWMPKLVPYLSGPGFAAEQDAVKWLNNMSEFRCPTADEPGSGPAAGLEFLGTATEAWGPAPVGWARAGLIGSYGLNMWTEDPSTVPVSASGPSEWFYSTMLQVRQPSDAPLFGDCIWDGGGWPGGNQDGLYPPPAVNPNAPIWTEGFLARFAIYRHARGVNLAFADGHAQWVSFEGMWGLKWHNGYTPRGGPPWMPSF